MTLGTGIFLSSLFLGVILLFWITKDRWRWSRIFLWLIGSIAAISALVLAYNLYEPPPTKQLEYANLKLGMSQREVNYLKGIPTNVLEDDPSRPGFLRKSKIDEGRTATDFLWWSYDLYGDARLHISFDSNKTVNGIRCYSKGYSNCPPVFGLHDGSHEGAVIARLGKPTSDALSESSTKRMVYAPLNVVFYLSRQKVYMIDVTADPE